MSMAADGPRAKGPGETLGPIAAFDVSGGVAVPLAEAWPRLDAATGYRWLHLPVQDERTARWAEAHLPPIAARALVQAETRPRCDRLEDGVILNLRGINLNPSAEPEDMVSVRFWVTAGGVVSARSSKVFAADALRRRAEAGSAPPSVGAFLAELIHALTNHIETTSVELEDRTDALEDGMLEGAAIDPEELSDVRQAVIKVRRFVGPQRDALASLSSIEDWILTDQERDVLRESADRTRRAVEELDAARERLGAVQDHLDADHANAIGRNSYILSVVSAIFLPLGFLTGLFGVNVAGMPGTEDASAFWWLTGACVAAGIGLGIVFRFAKWL